ncbi:MAG: endonuclease domain-containing protein [Janthinobacterium lividum]
MTRARDLRRDTTPAERVLWQVLRRRALDGAKFRRQVPCGRYILDYAALSAKLAIEVDGESHFVADGPARDAERTAWLAAQGWRVLRFTNPDVLSNLDGVLQTVAAAVAERPPHPNPLPEGKGEEP